MFIKKPPTVPDDAVKAPADVTLNKGEVAGTDIVPPEIAPVNVPDVAVIAPVMFALVATNPVEVKAKPVPDNPLLLRTTLLPKDIEELALVRDNPLLFRVYPVPETPPPNVPVAADILSEKVPPPFTVNVVPSQVNLSFSENVPFDPK